MAVSENLNLLWYNFVPILAILRKITNNTVLKIEMASPYVRAEVHG